ncbi:MAG: DegT/DnrJ/EryC1/StrS family aminotransferase, partial [Lachnospiraceae bacterium]|nr:DegT/DnrJ/EryC1/StrS family aminotransferase [Lachnospiraceae bacterium]
AFAPLQEQGLMNLPVIPEGCVHNAHMFYVKLKDLAQRTDFMNYLKEHDIQSTFHYIPLHSAPAGIKYGRFDGEDEYTTKESERLTRLPMYYNLSQDDRIHVIEAVKKYFL